MLRAQRDRSCHTDVISTCIVSGTNRRPSLRGHDSCLHAQKPPMGWGLCALLFDPHSLLSRLALRPLFTSTSHDVFQLTTSTTADPQSAAREGCVSQLQSIRQSEHSRPLLAPNARKPSVTRRLSLFPLEDLQGFRLRVAVLMSRRAARASPHILATTFASCYDYEDTRDASNPYRLRNGTAAVRLWSLSLTCDCVSDAEPASCTILIARALWSRGGSPLSSFAPITSWSGAT